VETLLGGGFVRSQAAIGGDGGLEVALERGQEAGHAIPFAGELVYPMGQRLSLGFEPALGDVQLLLEG
jgi:hypothetical protein